MPATLETTVHDMKTHFSQYAASLLAGDVDEIVVKNRTVPTLRVVRYVEPEPSGLSFGLLADDPRAEIDYGALGALDAEIAAEMLGGAA